MNNDSIKLVDKNMYYKKFLESIYDLQQKGAVYFQLDDRIINSFNKESSILRYPIIKIADKEFNIILSMNMNKIDIDITSAKNMLIMSGLTMIN